MIGHTRRGLRTLVIVLAFVEAGWLTFDGSRALVTGDYVTPRSGQFAGQLGPWSGVVESVGIEPRSTLMKSIHVGLGATWLVIIAAFSMNRRGSRQGMVACAAAALWYLPFGTLLSVVQIVLLLLERSRDPARART